MLMGVAMGLYVPLNLYARDSDCYSSAVSKADMVIGLHRLWDSVEFTDNISKAMFYFTFI